MTAPTPRRTDIATMLFDRVGDTRPGLRTRERDWTWDDVVRESAARAALATALQDSLFPDEPGHIGVLLDNVADFVFWLGGAALAGATLVGLNPTRGSADLAADIRHADCALIVTDRRGWDRLRELAHGLPAERFLLVDDPGYQRRVDAHRADPVIAPGVDGTRLMLLLFTSGTTGASKAVRCSQGRLARIAYAAAEKYGHHRGDIDYCCMPLFHGNAIMALWAPALAVGATVCLAPTFSASRFLPDVRFFGATFFTYVGKAMAYLLSTPQRDDDAVNTLTRGFGTEASPEDQQEFRRRFGAELFEGYGSSEGGAVAVADPAAPPGALGRPAGCPAPCKWSPNSAPTLLLPAPPFGQTTGRRWACSAHRNPRHRSTSSRGGSSGATRPGTGSRNLEPTTAPSTRASSRKSARKRSAARRRRPALMIRRPSARPGPRRKSAF